MHTTDIIPSRSDPRCDRTAEVIYFRQQGGAHTLAIYSSNDTKDRRKLHLSAAVIQERHAKGLCYYYDDKYIIGHKCCQDLHIMFTLDEFNYAPDTLQTLEDLADLPLAAKILTHMEVNQHTLIVTLSTRPMKF